MSARTSVAFPKSDYVEIIARHSTDSVVLTDAFGLIEWVNPAFEAMTGYQIEDVTGKKPGDFLQGPETDPATVKAISMAIRRQEHIRTEILNYTCEGDPYWIEMVITPIFDRSGELVNFVSMERDISVRKKLEAEREQALKEAQKRVRERRLLSETMEWLHAARGLGDLFEITEMSLGRLLPGTRCSLYTYSNSRDVLEATGRWGDGHSPSHLQPDDCWAMRRGRPYARGLSEIGICCPHIADERSPHLCLPLVAHGETLGMLSIELADEDVQRSPKQAQARIEEIWEGVQMFAEQLSLSMANVQLRQALSDQSVRDQLTGLYNRRWFVEHAQKDLIDAINSGSEFSLIAVDVDHFKRFNDEFGHDAGDHVLSELSEVMRTLFPEDATPCRVGGEEFTVLCRGLSLVDCAELADTFRREVQKIKLKFEDGSLPRLSVSCGVASLSSAPERDLRGLIKAADEALYRAKAAGRNCVICEPSKATQPSKRHVA